MVVAEMQDKALSLGKLVDDVIGNYADDDTASIALPSGHAASTKSLRYLTCFTNVIFCQGSKPDEETVSKYIKIIEPKIFNAWNAIELPELKQNLPKPSTSNVYWYTRSMQMYGKLLMVANVSLRYHHK